MFIDCFESEYRPMISKRLKQVFPWMSVDDVEFWLQHLAMLILAGQIPESKQTPAYLWRMVRNAIFDSLRRKKRQALSLDRRKHSDGRPVTFEDVMAASPSAIAVEKERHSRRERLLSDILHDWATDCEDRKVWRERECTERNLRGQSHDEAANEMDVSIQTQYTMSAQGFRNIRQLIERDDVNRSVFATLFAARHDRTPLPPETLPMHQESRAALVTWLIETVGVLCFSESILDVWCTNRQSLSATARSAINYHLHQCTTTYGSGWPMCTGQAADHD